MPSRSQDQISDLHILAGGHLPDPQEPAKDLLESFPNCYPNRPYLIHIDFPEFTSLCPVTGQPDFGTIVVDYVPDARCVESKSFKLYMFAFRNHQSFMETIVNRIFEDLWASLQPCWCRVQGLFVPRGGTRLNIVVADFKTLPLAQEQRVKEVVASLFLGQTQ